MWSEHQYSLSPVHSRTQTREMKTFPAILFIITFNSLLRDTDEAPWRRWRPVFRGFDDGPELYVPKWSTLKKPAIATAFATDLDEPAAVGDEETWDQLTGLLKNIKSVKKFIF